MWLAHTGDSTHKEWEQAMVEVFESGATPALRAFVAHRTIDRLKEKCPGEVVWAIVHDTAEILQENGPCNGFHLTAVLNWFYRLDHNEQWMKTARDLMEGWEVKAVEQSDPVKKRKNFQPNTDVIMSVMQIYLALGDRNKVIHLIDKYEDDLRNDAKAFALLVRDNESWIVEEWIHDVSFSSLSPIMISTSSFPVFEIRYDEKLDRQLNRYLETLDLEEFKLFAELAIKSAPDADGGSFPERNKRLGELARKVDSFSFRNDKERFDALTHLGRLWQFSGAITGVLDKNLPDDKTFDPGNSYWTYRDSAHPFHTRAVGKLKYDADVTEFSKLLDRIIKNMKYLDEMHAIRDLQDLLSRWLLSEMPTLSADQENAALEALSLLTEKSPRILASGESEPWPTE